MDGSGGGRAASKQASAEHQRRPTQTLTGWGLLLHVCQAGRSSSAGHWRLLQHTEEQGQGMADTSTQHPAASAALLGAGPPARPPAGPSQGELCPRPPAGVPALGPQPWIACLQRFGPTYARQGGSTSVRNLRQVRQVQPLSAVCSEPRVCWERRTPGCWSPFEAFASPPSNAAQHARQRAPRPPVAAPRLPPPSREDGRCCCLAAPRVPTSLRGLAGPTPLGQGPSTRAQQDPRVRHDRTRLMRAPTGCVKCSHRPSGAADAVNSRRQSTRGLARHGVGSTP